MTTPTMQRIPWQPPTTSPWPAAQAVAQRLHEAGQQAVFVGGCVRDHLLGLPVHDCDLATDASPEVVEALFAKTIAVGRSFGVMIVVHHGQAIEVASFRADGVYIDGRRPDHITTCDEAGDVQRRDFTINALIGDPQAGEIRDHVGGLADLEQRILRVVGEARARLSEDRLRILRALRFTARFQLTIAADSAQALHELRPTGLSRERIWDEWDKALALDHPMRERWWQLLREYDVTSNLIPPELAIDHGAAATALARAEHLSATEAQALLLFAAPPKALARWLDQEPISKERRNLLSSCPSLATAWLAATTPLQKLRLARQPHAASAGKCLVASGKTAAGEALLSAVASAIQRGPIPRLIDGQDLKAAGCQPGPEFARLLRRTEDAWLLGEISERQEALAKLRDWMGDS